jgi:hypothetical protein
MVNLLHMELLGKHLSNYFFSFGISVVKCSLASIIYNSALDIDERKWNFSVGD